MSEEQLNGVTSSKAAKRAATAAEPAAETVEPVTEAATEMAEEIMAVEPMADVSDVIEMGAEVAEEAAIVAEPTVEAMAPELSETVAPPTPADFADRATRGLHAVSEASAALARGAGEVSRSWLDAGHSGLRLHYEGLSRLADCRKASDLLATQSEIARQSLETFAENSRSIARASSQAIDEAGKALRGVAP